MKKSHLVQGIAGLVVLLFTYTALSKIFDLPGFRENMFNQRLPHWLTFLIIWGIPPLEVAIICCLVFRRTQKAGLYMSLCLLSVYTLYIAAILLHFFRSIPCPCGGIFRHMNWQQHFWFNLLFITLTLFAIALDKKSLPPDNQRFIHH